MRFSTEPADLWDTKTSCKSDIRNHKDGEGRRCCLILEVVPGMRCSIASMESSQRPSNWMKMLESAACQVMHQNLPNAGGFGKQKDQHLEVC